MSAIDQYNHELLGFIECNSEYDIVYESNSIKHISLYRLLEDIPVEENDFDGKIGDILLGGGSGEAPALRLTMPDCINFLFDEDWEESESIDDLIKVFWTPTEAFKLCAGFLKYGWHPERNIEYWLAENICSILIDQFGLKTANIKIEKSTLVFIPA